MKELSKETLEVVKTMVQFCVSHGYCMGMDEGLILGENSEDDTNKPFRDELESFCGISDL